MTMTSQTNMDLKSILETLQTRISEITELNQNERTEVSSSETELALLIDLRNQVADALGITIESINCPTQQNKPKLDAVIAA